MSSGNVLIPSDGGRGPPKFYNQVTGIQTIRGGQQVGDGFFASVLNSFYNIIYHFWGLTFTILGFAILLSEYGTTSGPLEMILRALIQVTQDVDAPIFVKSIATFLVWVFAIMVRYKYLLAYMLLLSVPVLVKPSGRNFGFSALVLFMAILHYITFLQVMVLAVLFYLFVMLRTPAHKFFVVALVVAVFAIGFSTERDRFVDRLRSFNLHDYDRKFSFEPVSLPDDLLASTTEIPIEKSHRRRHTHNHELHDQIALLRDHIEALEAAVAELSRKKKEADVQNLREEETQTPPFPVVPDVAHRAG